MREDGVVCVTHPSVPARTVVAPQTLHAEVAAPPLAYDSRHIAQHHHHHRHMQVLAGRRRLPPRLSPPLLQFSQGNIMCGEGSIVCVAAHRRL